VDGKRANQKPWFVCSLIKYHKGVETVLVSGMFENIFTKKTVKKIRAPEGLVYDQQQTALV